MRPTPSPQDDEDSPCRLCPVGDTPVPLREVHYGPDTNFTCLLLEIGYAAMDESQCADIEDSIPLYRSLCECQGYEPRCALCGGEPVEDPDWVLLEEDDETPEITCATYQLASGLMDSADCSTAGELHDTLEDICGCP